MAYIGKQPEFTQYPSKFFDGDGSAMTVTLDYAPPNDAALLVFISGVRQDTSAYNCTGTSLTFTGSVPSGTANVQVVHMGLTVDVGVPGDDTVTTVKIQDDAVTAAKLANSINTEIAANTAKVTNATHTGDVTGATALTIATDAVDIAMLSATGTASSSTFLRGDNAWSSAGLSNWTESGGSLLPNDAAYGIYLGVNSATAANLLDDYEEGSWTPIAKEGDTGSEGTITTSSTTGTYIKIGSFVMISYLCARNDAATLTGNLKIYGLPFAINSSSLNIACGSYWSDHGGSSVDTWAVSIGGGNSTTFVGMKNSFYNNTGQGYTATDFIDGRTINGTYFYRTD